MTDDVLSRMIVKTGAPSAPADAPATIVSERTSSAVQALARMGVETIACLPSPEQASTPPPEDAPAFGRYRIGERIGRGAAGEVFEAYDPELRRWVAVKVLHTHVHEPEVVERFVAEAHVTAQLEHPGIVSVHDFGVTADGLFFFVMQRVRGRTLFEMLGQIARRDEATCREWRPHRRLTAFVQICRAVGYAHQRGVVHRDLKPSNLMFGAFGEALVMDWGIARVLRGMSADPVSRHVSHKTLPGAAIGTIGYMSPEQMMGAHEHLKAASDVWSLGVILYEMLTVRRALKGTLDEVCSLATRGPLPVHGLPATILAPAVGAIVQRATAVAIHERYAHAGELADAVEAYLADVTSGAHGG